MAHKKEQTAEERPDNTLPDPQTDTKPPEDPPENEAKNSAPKPDNTDSKPDSPSQSPPGDASGDVAALNDRYLRLNAEYVNYRNRTAREKEALWNTAKSETLAPFLPVLDNLERAVEAETEESSLRQGLEMILRQFREVLEKQDVKEIDAIGKPFDPKLMDAVMHTEDDTLGENTVKQVFTKGYTLGDRVIRHAVVVVAN